MITDAIQFVHLSEVEESDLVDLMNHEKVRAYLPLLSGGFTAAHCRAFREAKRRLWDEHGYGPWGILIHGSFAGWGGLQPEHGDADFALVLHPDYWGWGRRIFNRVRDLAFSEMDLESITILLPPNRPNSGAVARLGFNQDGETYVDGECFTRFRLVRT